MRFAAALSFSLLAILGACTKDSAHTKRQAQGTVGADGVRRIPVEAGKTGYDPDTIHAKSGEKLILVFRRTAEGECLSQVKVAGGPPIDLPMNEDVEVPVTAPASGKVGFICGMDMQTGVIAVD
jgi:plastocyanin domain-containing protein